MHHRLTIPKGPLTRVIAAGQWNTQKQRQLISRGVRTTQTLHGTIRTGTPAKAISDTETNYVPRWG